LDVLVGRRRCLGAVYDLSAVPSTNWAGEESLIPFPAEAMKIRAVSRRVTNQKMMIQDYSKKVKWSRLDG
jgi:hypothetical protein